MPEIGKAPDIGETKIKDLETNHFQNIKAEGNMSVQEAKQFWHDMFDKPANSDDSASEQSDKNEVLPRTPEEHGEWEGEKGNSVFHPEPDYVPPEKSRNPKEKPYSNPDNLMWKEIFEKFGKENGIPFKNGFAVFNEFSKATIEIDDFETGGSDAKVRNFRKADRKLAEAKGCSPEEVKEWRAKNNYTWHECEDKRTMQKVPNEIHANIPHEGGRAQ